MASELYMVSPDESAYVEDKLEMFSELDIYLGQIRMVLGGENGAILGASEFGPDLESMVYELDLDETNIRGKVASHIVSFCTYYTQFKTDIKVKFAQGPEGVRDACFIDIIIDGRKSLQYRIT